jgi:hypothetical protein
MSWVTMWDAIRANIAAIPADAEMVAGYVTGTPDIRWEASDWRRYSGIRQITIDQGGIGSPVSTATVRDVEDGAWLPEPAVRDTANWNAGRRTIYCNLDTLPRVLAAGWRGDLWLAIPSNVPHATPPDVPGCTVVAVQYKFAGSYDQSIVYDPYWPARSPFMSGTQYAAPALLRETATVSISWEPVPDVDGTSPTGYTASFLGLDGKEYLHTVTDKAQVTVTGLEKGWTYNVHVWANGGELAPPHAAIIVHT